MNGIAGLAPAKSPIAQWVARLGSTVGPDAATGVSFLRKLPRFLRHPTSVQRAEAVLKERLRHREASFLGLARTAIFGNPASPYQPLLRWAGCQYADLERLVQHDGVEAALRALVRQGVFLQVDEFKGRRDVRRGGLIYRVDPSQMRNPSVRPHLPGQSSGSRGRRFSAPLDLAFVGARTVNYALIAAHLLPPPAVHGVWKTPGGDVLDNLLCFAGFGAVAERWFLQIDPAAPGLHRRYRWSVPAVRVGGWLAGMRLPRPEIVTLDDPLPIGRWIEDVLRRGATPHLQLFCSAGLRLCQAATAAGIDLRGAWLMVGGEPLTPARASVMRAAGVTLLPRYGTAEAPSIGIGCTRPEAADDVHLLSDLYAIVTGEATAGTAPLPPGALWLSSLCPTAPMILLNVSMGDQAVFGHAPCGCPLAELGWTTRFHTLRSFEKLTAGGMTFLDADVARVLEEVLPHRFGGGPADYQLVEEECADGRPSIRLLVHPRVNPSDLDLVGQAFLDAISAEAEGGNVMGRLWRDAKFLRVECRPPLTTASGKILHLHSGSGPGA